MSKKSEDNSFGVAGVVLGIISIVLVGSLGVVLGIVGVIFGINQKKIKNNSWAKWGIILNIIGIVLGIIVTYILIKYFSPQISV